MRHRLSTAALVAILLVAIAGCSCSTRTAGAGDRSCPAELQKCTFLLPLAYNNGTPVPPEVLTGLKDRLFEQFGGYTIAGTAEGTYRLADGTRADDRCLVVWVAVAPHRTPELRRVVAELAHELHQESIYFETSEPDVQFIGPAR